MIVARGNPSQNYWRYEDINNRPKRKIKLKKSRITKILCCLFLLISVLNAIFLISHYNKINHISREIVRYETQLKGLHEEQAHLKLQIAGLRTLKRIESIAVNELGMIYPREGHPNKLVATTN